MAEDFVPLAALLRASASRAARSEASAMDGSASATSVTPASVAAEPSANPSPRSESERAMPELGDALHVRTAATCEHVVEGLALMRLAALEAFERARLRLLEALAREVLARELMLAPADLDALAARALRVFAESEPLALLVSPADAERVSSPLPVRVDPALSAGDLLVAVHDGEIDARFELRVTGAILAAAAT